jgi:hypothetical protein
MAISPFDPKIDFFETLEICSCRRIEMRHQEMRPMVVPDEKFMGAIALLSCVPKGWFFIRQVLDDYVLYYKMDEPKYFMCSIQVTPDGRFLFIHPVSGFDCRVETFEEVKKCFCLTHCLEPRSFNFLYDRDSKTESTEK